MTGTTGRPNLNLGAGRGGRRLEAFPSSQQATPARRGVEDDRNAAQPGSRSSKSPPSVVGGREAEMTVRAGSHRSAAGGPLQ